jgi:RHS repeat-associated protein
VAEHTGCTVNPFQFVGHSEYCRDAQTSNYSVRNRVLSPGLTRWLTLPPLTAIWTSQEAVDQREIEQYRYASSAPTTLIDPSGLPNPPPRPKPPSDPKPGQCLVMFECANVAIFGYHCGIAIKWWNGGTLQTRTYHAHGLYARVLGCKLERADGLRPHPYGLQNIDYHSEAVCTCIRNAVDTFNEGITRAGASYMLDPFNACGGGPHCNSNYATKCVLRACGLSPPKPETIFYVAGWDFRMYICMESSPRTHCRCVCERWKRLDDTWCGGPPSTATHAD